MLRGTLGQRVEDNLSKLLRRTAQMLEKDRDTVLCVAARARGAQDPVG